MLLVVTNKGICKGDFYERVEEIAKGRPEAIILREKDLTPEVYAIVAKACNTICKKYEVRLIVNYFIEVAKTIGIKSIHLSFEVFKNRLEELKDFDCIGVSIHSKEEAIFAEEHGCTYLLAGHIFQTDCKKDLEPRGLDFLGEICHSVAVPVFGIGGIDEAKVQGIFDCGSKGFGVMSELMECSNPYERVCCYNGKKG